MSEKIRLLDLNEQELKDYVKNVLQQPAFRADQIAKWLIAGADIDEMTNLSLALREKIHETAVLGGARIVKTLTSQKDDTRKFLFEMEDGQIVEGVLMSYHHGHTLCLSTQVGCRMGCAFCASTLEGLVRNLTEGEMLGQIIAVNKALGGGRQVDNLVLMGSGEPLDNFNNVVRMLRRLNDPEGLGISLRNVSLSTCGLVDQMDRFSREGLPVTLCLSLHAPNDEIRRQIMPVARAYGIKDAVAALKRYTDRTGRRAIVEYSLIRNVNDSAQCAEELAQLLRGMRVHVNVIALNPVKERSLEAPKPAQVNTFLKTLERCHISATRRRTMGEDIEGACGQLRRKNKEMFEKQ